MYVARTELKSLKLKVKYRNIYNKEITQCIKNEAQIPKSTIVRNVYCFHDSSSESEQTNVSENTVEHKQKVGTNFGYKRYVFALRKNKHKRRKELVLNNFPKREEDRIGNGAFNKEKTSQRKSPSHRKKKIKTSVVSMPARNDQSDHTCLSGEDLSHPDTMLSIPPPPKPSRGKFSFARIRAKRIPFIDKMAALESRGFLCNALLDTSGNVSTIDIMNTNTYLTHSVVVEENGDVPPCSDDILEDDISDELDSPLNCIPYEGVSNEEPDLLYEADNLNDVSKPEKSSDQKVCTKNIELSKILDPQKSTVLASAKPDDILKLDPTESSSEVNAYTTDTALSNTNDSDVPQLNGVCNKPIVLRLNPKTIRSSKESKVQETRSNGLENIDSNTRNAKSFNSKEKHKATTPESSKSPEENMKPVIHKPQVKRSSVIKHIKGTAKQGHGDKVPSDTSSPEDIGAEASNSEKMTTTNNSLSSTTGAFIEQSKSWHDSKLSNETDVVKLCITHAMPIKVREKIQRVQATEKILNRPKSEHIQTSETEKDRNETTQIAHKENTLNVQKQNTTKGQTENLPKVPAIKQEPQSPIESDTKGVTNKSGERNIFDALYKPSIPSQMTSPLKSSDLLSGLSVSDMDDFLSFTIDDSDEESKSKKEDEKEKPQVLETNEAPDITVQIHKTHGDERENETNIENSDKKHPVAKETKKALETSLNMTDDNRIEINKTHVIDKHLPNKVPKSADKVVLETKQIEKDGNISVTTNHQNPNNMELKLEDEKPRVHQSTVQSEYNDELTHNEDVKTINSSELEKETKVCKDLIVANSVPIKSKTGTPKGSTDVNSSKVGDREPAKDLITDSPNVTTKQTVRSSSRRVKDRHKQTRQTRSKTVTEKQNKDEKDSNRGDITNQNVSESCDKQTPTAMRTSKDSKPKTISRNASTRQEQALKNDPVVQEQTIIRDTVQEQSVIRDTVQEQTVTSAHLVQEQSVESSPTIQEEPITNVPSVQTQTAKNVHPVKEETVKSLTPVPEQNINSVAPNHEMNIELNKNVPCNSHILDKVIQKPNKRKSPTKEQPQVKQRRIIDAMMEKSNPESDSKPSATTNKLSDTLLSKAISELESLKPVSNPLLSNGHENAVLNQNMKASIEPSKEIPTSPHCHSSKKVETSVPKHYNTASIESKPCNSKTLTHNESDLKRRGTKTVKELLEEKIYKNLSAKESKLANTDTISNKATMSGSVGHVIVNAMDTTTSQMARKPEQEDIAIYSQEHKLKTAYRRHQIAKMEAEALAKASETVKLKDNFQMLNGRGLVDPDLNITLLVNPHNEKDRKRISIPELTFSIYDPPSQRTFSDSHPKSKRRRLSNNTKSVEKRVELNRSLSDNSIARQLSSPASNHSFDATSGTNQSFLALVHVASELREKQQLQKSPHEAQVGAATQMDSPNTQAIVVSSRASSQVVSPSVNVHVSSSQQPHQVTAPVVQQQVISRHNPIATSHVHCVTSSVTVSSGGQPHGSFVDRAQLQNTFPFAHLPLLTNSQSHPYIDKAKFDLLIRQGGLDPSLTHLLLYGRGVAKQQVTTAQFRPPFPFQVPPQSMSSVVPTSQSIRPSQENAAIRNMLIRAPPPRMAAQITPSTITQTHAVPRPPNMVRMEEILPQSLLPLTGISQLPVIAQQPITTEHLIPQNPQFMIPRQPLPVQNQNPLIPKPRVRPRMKVPKTTIDQYKKDLDASRQGQLKTSVTYSPTVNLPRYDNQLINSQTAQDKHPITVGLLSDDKSPIPSVVSEQNVTSQPVTDAHPVIHSAPTISALASQQIEASYKSHSISSPTPSSNTNIISEHNKDDVHKDRPHETTNAADNELPSSDNSNIPLVVRDTSPAHLFTDSDDGQENQEALSKKSEHLPPEDRIPDKTISEIDERLTQDLPDDDVVISSKPQEPEKDIPLVDHVTVSQSHTEIDIKLDTSATTPVDNREDMDVQDETETFPVIVDTNISILDTRSSTPNDTEAVNEMETNIMEPHSVASDFVNSTTTAPTESISPDSQVKENINEPVEPVVSTQSDVEPVKSSDVEEPEITHTSSAISRKRNSPSVARRKRKPKKIQRRHIVQEKVEPEVDDSARLQDNISPDTTVVTPPAVLGVVVKLEAPPEMEVEQPAPEPEPPSFTRSLSVSSFDLDAECDESIQNSKQPLQAVSSDDLWQELLHRKSLCECVCGASFTSSVLYMLHRACHNTDEPHWCATCGCKCATWMDFFVHLYDHNK